MTGATSAQSCAVLPPARARPIGPVSSASNPATATRPSTLQVNAAEAVREARSVSPRPSGPVSTGTSTPANAPPATTSKTMLGTRLAVWYAVPRQVSPTVCEKT